MLPPWVSREVVQDRLLLLFPDALPGRNYCVREMAASTVFVALYIGAVEGSEACLAPRHVCRMSNDQAEKQTDAERTSFHTEASKSGFVPLGKAWYADNTREPIRDETLRHGLIQVGAATELKNIPTTSPKARYSLKSDFAALFDPSLIGADLDAAMTKWRTNHLSAAALARVALVRAGAGNNPEDFLVTFPNGETQRLAPGESSIIAKAVIEEFAKRFLSKPDVLWLSESRNKVVARHDVRARSIGLTLDAGKLLPDVILVDLDEPLLLVFVEIVATDGPVSEARREQLAEVARQAKFADENTAFVTAFLDRASPSLRKSLDSIAWNSFVFIASEPEGLIMLHRPSGHSPGLLHRLAAAARSAEQSADYP